MNTHALVTIKTIYGQDRVYPANTHNETQNEQAIGMKAYNLQLLQNI